jgi:hypothetical protein
MKRDRRLFLVLMVLALALIIPQAISAQQSANPKPVIAKAVQKTPAQPVSPGVSHPGPAPTPPSPPPPG